MYDSDGRYRYGIDAAYDAASAALLALMQRELGLPQLLQELRHYFLQDRCVLRQ